MVNKEKEASRAPVGNNGSRILMIVSVLRCVGWFGVVGSGVRGIGKEFRCPV